MSTPVGEQLRQAREADSLTLEQVAQATRIRIHYLEALEAGDFSALPSVAQGRGFLRAYAGYLNLDAQSLLGELDGEGAGMASPPAGEPGAGTPAETTSPASAPTQKITAAGMEDAGAIFAEVGQHLRRQRELLGLSLDDVERYTRLRRHYLQALEDGDLEGLPSPVQGRGMLKNYAVFLGIDADTMLLRFADGLQARFNVRQKERPMRPAHVRRRPWLSQAVRRLFSGELLVGGALAMFLVVFVLWAAVRIYTVRSEVTSSPTAPSIVEVLLAPPSATTTPSQAPVTVTAPPSTLSLPTLISGTEALVGAAGGAGGQPGVQVYIAVRQRAWMRVIVDGKVEFDGRVIPGSAYPFTGDSQIEVQTGNAAALQVIYNQQDLGPLGDFGQVVLRICSREGILSPTSTITLTPTITPPPTAMPTSTPSPRPTKPGEATIPPLP